jgi:integrase
MSKRLTAKSFENAKPGTSRREISDGGSGLYLIVQTSGHKSWAVRFRVKGIPRKLTLDAGLSLADARIQAAAAIKQAQGGNDPTQAKKVAKQERTIAAANTFEAVALLYLNTDKVKKLRTADQVRDRLTRQVFPIIGREPIADLKKSQIVKALDQIEQDSGPVAADRALSNIMGVLKFHDDRSDNFLVPRIKPRTSAKDRARDRILTDDEIRKLWATGNRFVQFLLLTGARRNEVAGMQWREVTGNDWTLPASRNKVKVDLIRTLSKQAMAVLPQRGDPDDYVFGIVPDCPLGNFARLKEGLDADSGVTGWTLHDLRRTARSLMSRAGVNSDHAERCLGHVIGGVRGVYDRHEYQDEKARALEMLAHQLMLIVNPPKGNNIRQLRRA